MQANGGLPSSKITAKYSGPQISGHTISYDFGGVVDRERSMATTRKQHSPKFKARVAVEAIRGEKTLSQLGSQFKVHPIQIAKWRKSALEQLPELFVDGRTRKIGNSDTDSSALYEEIGRLKMELDWLKKKVGMLIANEKWS